MLARLGYSFLIACAVALPVLPSQAAECGAGVVRAGTLPSTPADDFIDNRDGTVTHLLTGLVWKRCAEGQVWSGNACVGDLALVRWEEALQMSVASGYASASDWRVPNRKELESIVEYCGHSPAINQAMFPPTPSERFWSSTTFVETPVHAWDVYFSDGYSGIANKQDGRAAVRLVRTAPAGTLLTRQRLSFTSTLPQRIDIGAEITVAAVSSAGLPVTVMSLSPIQCSVVGNTLRALAEGVCGIAADQGGNASVYPAVRLTADVVVGRLAQRIEFGPAAAIAIGQNVSMTVQASSGLPVSLANLTPSVCSLNGRDVMGLANGTCTVLGTQAGDANYQAAAPASIAIPVGGAGGETPPTNGPTISYPQDLSAGWHLLGNSVSEPIDVVARYGDPQFVESVWKWLPELSVWAFYTPQLSAAALHAYLAERALKPLAEIRPGEAFWLKLRAARNFGPRSGTPYVLGASSLLAGWNLVSTGTETTPSALNLALSNAPPGVGGATSGFTSLWAWDSTRSRWYFYSPALDAQGGGRLKEYTDQRGLLDFASERKTIGQGVGFWIRK